jgi:glycosyl-4,4'-diaponeurosporenoate acyltransferase
LKLPSIQEAANWYFMPRAFGGGNFYPRLGVRIYKKYLPTSGEVISRFRGIDRLKIAATGSRRQALLNYELQTRTWEGRHLVSAVLLQAWAVIGGAMVDMEQFWASSVINVLVNIYPIMVQRFNRARIATILEDEPRQRANILLERGRGR